MAGYHGDYYFMLMRANGKPLQALLTIQNWTPRGYKFPRIRDIDFVKFTFFGSEVLAPFTITPDMLYKNPQIPSNQCVAVSGELGNGYPLDSNYALFGDHLQILVPATFQFPGPDYTGEKLDLYGGKLPLILPNGARQAFAMTVTCGGGSYYGQKDGGIVLDGDWGAGNMFNFDPTVINIT